MIYSETKHEFIIDAITLIHLPEGPSAYFKLTSFTPAKNISVSAF